MQALSLVQLIATAIIPLLMAITLHEVAHGWMANRLGDPTARMLGRLTINPLKHIDPLGTIVIPLVLLVSFGYAFGWAKPVPITPRNLQHPRRDMALISFAGPAANLLMAAGWTLILCIIHWFLPVNYDSTLFLKLMAIYGILINVVLMCFNLLPIPPLDGGHIVASLLPPRWEYYYNRLEPYGLFIIMGLLFLNILQFFISPIMAYTQLFIAQLIF